MSELLAKLWGGAKTGTRAIATGNAQAALGLQSPYLPTAMVRVGRFLYIALAGWIGAAWYSGYVNLHTAPGSGPTLLIPGMAGPATGTSVNRALPKATWDQTQGAAGTAGGAAVTTGKGTGGGGSDPFPGATGSRLDQGFDLTSTRFLAPAPSKIVFASASVSGWQGGGLVAGQILSGPKKGMVWYMAEGLTPTVHVGQIVNAGTQVATPARNPYNGITGNIEAGWANPSSPTQPLAQVSANKPGVAWDFYNWIRSLGGPAASSTGNAGYP